eukprot:15481809-Alexandrium_andersonii.AAC.1
MSLCSIEVWLRPKQAAGIRNSIGAASVGRLLSGSELQAMRQVASKSGPPKAPAASEETSKWAGTRMGANPIVGKH